MPSLADVVREHAPAYVARHGEALPKRHARALDAITDCRTGVLGAEVAVCAQCNSSHLLFHSCRHRACPRCGFDATTRWIERQQKALLPVRYFHVVFTLPDELRRLVRERQRILLDVLFRTAFESLQALAADPTHLGAQIGAIGVLHTWTRTLEWHPHVHFLVPGGGLAPDGRTFVSARRPGRADFLVPVRPLAMHFRGRFLHRARRALPHVRFPTIPWDKPWVVYAKPSFEERPNRLLDYLGRYVHRTALSEKRIAACDDQSVTFTYRDSTNGQRKEMTLTGGEFLRRFLQHVPLPGFHRVRAYGLLHPRHRTTLQRLQLLLHAQPPEPPKQAAALPATHAPATEPNKECAALQAAVPAPSLRIPLPCPLCHTGLLRIVARLSAIELRDDSIVAIVLARARAPP